MIYTSGMSDTSKQKNAPPNLLDGFNRKTALLLLGVIAVCFILVIIFPDLTDSKLYSGGSLIVGIAFGGPIVFAVLVIFKVIQKLYRRIRSRKK